MDDIVRRKTRKRFVYANVAIFIILGIGVVGFRLLEEITWLESLYLTATTITTVGYGNLAPESSGGQFFAVIYMLFGVGVVLYALSLLAQLVIQAELISILGVKRKDREMENLSDHFVVCGAGRVGRRVIKSIIKDNRKYVVVERNHSKIDLLDDDAFVVEGDATLEENLQKAGIERAAGLACCLAEDAQNVYTVLIARGLNPDLHIVARAVEDQAETKLIRAGANRVVSPNIIGSRGMARSLMRPAIADFMDSIVAENLDLVFEEIALDQNSKYANKMLKETNLSKELNLLVVAIRRREGEMIFNPSGNTTLLAGDLLVVIGKASVVKTFSDVD